MPADRNEPSAEREERSRVIPLPGQAMGRDVTQRQPGDGAGSVKPPLALGSQTR
jgi:hypothetical protein